MTIANLIAVRPDEPTGRASLERFLSEHVVSDGEAADGFAHTRIVERSETRARIVGSLWLLRGVGRRDAKPFFWFEVESKGHNDVSWRLCFEVLSINGNRRPHAIANAEFLLQTPDQAEWRVEVSGTAVISGHDLSSVVETERRA